MTATKTNSAPSILARVAAYITQYVKIGSGELFENAELLVTSLWVLHTWTFGATVPNPITTPYLYIFSAEKRSGKTRLLEVLETIIRNPLRAADVTSPVLFRSIEAFSPTILLDEVDAIWSGAKNEELRGVLNAGYKRGGFVYRVVKNEPTPFNVFGPKALAGIDNAMLPDTIRDRSIPIHMHRQNTGETMPFYSSMVADFSEDLLGEIADWIEKNWPREAMNFPANPIDGISDRAWEISMPLIMLARILGCEGETRAAILALMTTEEQLSPQAQLLSDIRDLFNEEGTNTIPAAMILEKIGNRATSGKHLANQLRAYGPKPGAVRFRNVVCRGYRKADFEDAWRRYL